MFSNSWVPSDVSSQDFWGAGGNSYNWNPFTGDGGGGVGPSFTWNPSQDSGGGPSYTTPINLPPGLPGVPDYGGGGGGQASGQLRQPLHPLDLMASYLKLDPPHPGANSLPGYLSDMHSLLMQHILKNGIFGGKGIF